MSKVMVLVAMMATTAAAEDKHLHAFGDIVTFDKPVTEQQCIDAGKKAIAAAGFTEVKLDHSATGQRTGDKLWIASVDCLQRHSWNAAYITVTSTETDKKIFESVSQGLVKAELSLGGKSELGIK